MSRITRVLLHIVLGILSSDREKAFENGYGEYLNLLALSDNGSKFGLHISHEGGINPNEIKKEILLLPDCVNKDELYSRNHYLRWREPESIEQMQDAGIKEDLTLGYADSVGFRVGTCRPYRFINPKTKRIHSFFHQTITATGRISSTEPNLQNIPTRFELGKRVRKIFKPEEGKVYIDSDYSQIELRVLAHISKDEHMIQAFKNNEDIHKQAASKVFKTPINEVTSQQRSNAKAVNFGIVYGISDYGLSEQLGISIKKAKQYINEYLEQYSGIKNFMDNITEKAKEQGYVETLFNRRRYIPELKSNNYMVRQFGARVAMNTPIQGTAADIMKIAMINVYNEIKKRGLKSKIVLQVHDEMMIEAPVSEVEEVKKIVVDLMQSATKLDVPLIAQISSADNWYDCK